ncbi:hypothetical protein CsSME_00004081 [Camellia sinensis var. sinensis]
MPIVGGDRRRRTVEEGEHVGRWKRDLQMPKSERRKTEREKKRRCRSPKETEDAERWRRGRRRTDLELE